MHKARAFFFVAAGIFLLALAYHLGARSATAQAPGNPAVALGRVPSAGGEAHGVLTANGDLYVDVSGSGQQWTYLANVFSGPTPATQETWGGVKARYRQGAAARDK